MNTKIQQAVKEAESNIYSGASLLKGTIVFLWALLSLFFINRIDSFLYSAALGTVHYISVIVLCRVMFRNIKRYLSFPVNNKAIPVFIGGKLDTILVYPIFLMSLTGIISSLLAVIGVSPAVLKQMNTAGSMPVLEYVIRNALLPLAVFAEELLNLLMVSCFYNYVKLPGRSRLLGSIFATSLIFGILHTPAWGAGAAISIAAAYIPVIFTTLYTGNIWISFLAHLYNDLIVSTKYYYGSSHFFIIAAIALIPAVWAITDMFRKTR